MALSEILSFFGGIIATLAGVILKTYIDDIKSKRDTVYRPLYREIARAKGHDFDLENGRIQTLWQQMSMDKKLLVSQDISELMSEYTELLNDLNKMLSALEDAIESDIEDPKGVLPKQITTYNENDRRSTSIVYSRKADGSIESVGGVNGFLNIAGADIIFADSSEELRESLTDHADPKWRARFDNWEKDCFTGLIRLASKAESQSVDRESKISRLNEVVEDLLKLLKGKLSIWKLLVN